MGWGLLLVGIGLASGIVVVGAVQAKSVADFDRWVGWATVAGLPIAAIGVALTVWEKVAQGARRAEVSADDAREAEDELAKVVLSQARVARSRLVGAGEAGDEAANVRFVKATGRFRAVGGAGEGDLDTVLEYYQSLSPRRLVILGEPGAGKTVLAMELVVALLERREQDKSIPAPVLVSAAAYDTSSPWEEWLAGHLAQRFTMGVKAAAGLVRDRRVLPIVDGLDEMDSAGKSEQARALITGLNSFMQGRERAAVVVTCRWEEYQTLGPGVDKATHVEMMPLDGREAADYLAGQLRGGGEERAWQPVLKCLRADPRGLVAVQLATPWRLTLALTVFRDGGSPAELLPGPLLDPYAQRVNALLLDRYVPSAVRLHDPSGHRTPGQVRRLLIALAKDLNRQAQQKGSATDIQLDKWWRPVGRLVTTIAHVALVVVLAVPWLVAATLGHTANAFLAIGPILMSVALAALPPAPPLRIYLPRLTTFRGVRWPVLGLVLGLVVGAVPLLFSPVPRRALWLVWGLMSGLVGGLILGVIDEEPQAVAVEPRKVISASGRSGLLLGSALGLVWGIFLYAFGFLGLWLAVMAGATVGLASGITALGDKWARYHIAVVIAALPPRSGPLRFGGALEWAYEAGLLRLAGIAYQFRHRQLQDWLRSGQ